MMLPRLPLEHNSEAVSASALVPANRFVLVQPREEGKEVGNLQPSPEMKDTSPLPVVQEVVEEIGVPYASQASGWENTQRPGDIRLSVLSGVEENKARRYHESLHPGQRHPVFPLNLPLANQSNSRSVLLPSDRESHPIVSPASSRRTLESSRAPTQRAVTKSAGRYVKASESLRNIRVSTGRTVRSGDVWKTVTLVEGMYDWIQRLYAGLFRKRALIIHIGITSLSILANLVYSLCMIVTFCQDQQGPLFYFLVLNMFFILPALANVFCQLWMATHSTQLSEQVIFMFLLSMLFYYCFGFLTSFLLWDLGVGYGITLLALLYATCAVFNTILVLSATILPLVILMGIFEFFVRMVHCRLTCPKQHPEVKGGDYQVYHFKADCYDVSECRICLAHYAEDEEICMLKCHESHVFHAQCLIEWLQKQFSCPICRQDAQFRNI